MLGEKTDLYIRLSINDLHSFPGMARCILWTILYCINQSRDDTERLMIVDEAFQVGKLQGFELLRDTMRKRGLNLMLIFQCGKACKDDSLGGKSASSLTHVVWLQKLLFVVQRWKGKRG